MKNIHVNTKARRKVNIKLFTNRKIIMTMKISIALAVLALIVTLSSCTNDSKSSNKSNVDSAHTEKGSTEEEYYTCPMHPSVRSDRPGACPVCGMALVKKSAQKDISQKDKNIIEEVSLSAAQRVIANISTTPVRRQTINKEITSVGVIDFAEPLQVKVAARFRGRIEKLHVNFTGDVVHKGGPLFELYSPDLVSAERELILAANAKENNTAGTNGYSENIEELLKAARDRLRIHFGMTNEQISAIERSRQAHPTATFYSPIHGTVIRKEIQEGQYVNEGMLMYQLADLSKVWIYLDVYEKDLRFIKIGQSVQITTEVYPGEKFTGRVTFIDPLVNPNTRTVRIRTEFPNSNGKLKPQMYVKANIVHPIQDALVIPTSALLSTGKRNVVWVEVKQNTFEPRTVELGAHTDVICEVRSGLKEGESIIVTGGFLLESESQLQQPTSATAEPMGGLMKHSLEEQKESTSEDGSTQEIRIDVDGAFTPDVIHVKLGKPVKLNFFRKEGPSCVTEILFKDFKIRRELPVSKVTTIKLTPKNQGVYTFSCGMDMVRGELVVSK